MRQIAGIDSNKFRVLMVDDLPLNIILMDKMLAPFEFQITKKHNGKEALEAIQAAQDTDEKFDLLILDLMMPQVDGYMALDFIRKGCDNGEFSIKAKSKEELPVIILSALSFGDDIKKGLDMGANRFLTKPVVMEELQKSVTEELEKHIKAGN